MEKQAVVTSVQGNGTYQGQYGLLYKWEVAFDNGDYGTAMTKEERQSTWVVNKEVKYDLQTKEYNGRQYFNVKAVQEKPAGGYSGGGSKYAKDPETEKRITRMSVLKAATDLVISEKLSMGELLIYAEVFEKWVYGEPVKMPNDDLPWQ
jgi:hypothetical protein